MTEDLQTALRDEQEGLEKEERELEQAEEEFKEEFGSDMVDVNEPTEEERAKERNIAPGSSDPRADEAAKEFINQLENTGMAESKASDKTPSPPKKGETAKENQQILAALGFKLYNDAGVIKYNIRVLDIKIGVTFNETNPLGKIWAYKIPEGDEEKKFLKNGELKGHLLIKKYEAIKEGKESLPEISVTGKILEKRGKAIKVEITENGETEEIFFGQGAVKKDKDGNYFIPAGFSKGGKDKGGKERDAKMSLPRDIQLPDYLTQLKQAPAADTTKKEDVPKEKEKIPPTDKSTLADVIHKDPVTLAEGEKPTVDYYVNLIGEITEKVDAEERIADRERGYAISKVFDAVTKDRRAALIAELKTKGGDHEE